MYYVVHNTPVTILSQNYNHTIWTLGKLPWYNRKMPEDAKGVIARLQAKGWTIAAIADAMGLSRYALDKWKAGARNPSHQVLVVAALKKLETRKRVPKRKRYPQGRRGRTS